MNDDDYQSRRAKCRAFRRALAALIAAVGAVVFRVQVAGSESLVQKSEHQQSRLTYLPAKRGNILDRNGTLLNGSVPRYDIAIRLDKIRDPRDVRAVTLNKVQTAISELAIYLGPEFYTYRPGRQAIEKHIRQNAPLPFVLWTDVPLDVTSRVRAAQDQFPFVELTMTWLRKYDCGNTASQIRGYVQKADAQKMLSDMGMGRMMNLKDMEGACGIEEMFNPVLQGRGGYQKLQTDVLSYRHGLVETTSPVMGENVTLTLDLPLQQRAEGILALSGHPGAIVLMDAANGEVLVMASYPMHHLPPQPDDKRLNGAFTNRAVSGFYPPGSTIKPFIALAALEQNAILPDETIFCPGYYTLPDGRTIKCSSKYGHGYINVTQAIAMSCNTFFCETAVRLGKKGLAALLEKPAYNQFFGQNTGISGIRHEAEGVFFVPGWHKNARNAQKYWSTGDLAHAGIGQGRWVVTPIQMAVYACAVTTGRLFRPKLVKNDLAALKTTLKWQEPAWIAVLQGLADCVQTPRGTGRRLKLNGITAFAKTGTAEHVAGKEPHAWMFVAAPAPTPEVIAVCVLEEGGHGGEAVAPVMTEFLNQVFNRRKTLNLNP